MPAGIPNGYFPLAEGFSNGSATRMLLLARHKVQEEQLSKAPVINPTAFYMRFCGANQANNPRTSPFP